MTVRAARAVARRLHSGQVSRSGEPLIEHVERVAGAVAASDRALAYLHDVLERVDSATDELRELELTDEEWDVLGLLTRRSRESYKLYVMRIARADGRAGAIARSIKLADLDDHLRHRQPRARTPDYSWARGQILASQQVRGEVDARWNVAVA
ncbi:MAG: metal-dependent phosphohydrolase [Solirubrobacteraceae bacterium]